MSLGWDRDHLYERRLMEQEPTQTHFSGEEAVKKLLQVVDSYEKPSTVAMDFDGVIAFHKTEWPPEKIGPPLKPGIEVAKRIKAAGHKLVILTAKPKSVHKKIKKWMAEQGVQVDDVTNTKPPAEIYIDDRGMRYPRNYKGKE